MDWKRKLCEFIDPVKKEAEPIETQITAQSAIKTLSDFVNLIENVQAQHDFNYQQVGNTDLETQDLLHEIELSTFNACTGYKLVRDLKKVRMDRRYYKDQNDLLDNLVTYIGAHVAVKKAMQNMLEHMVNKIEYKKQRTYSPRIRQEHPDFLAREAKDLDKILDPRD